jgi:hypothetical protein
MFIYKDLMGFFFFELNRFNEAVNWSAKRDIYSLKEEIITMVFILK